ncbi:MAG: hypothetical protein Kow00121_61110 [Elainellaceae cyanobacterium]
MFPTVLPLRAIVFQILFLLVAIAVEAAVFRRLLDPTPKPKQIVQYTVSINLLCTVVGWIVFFILFGFADALSANWAADAIAFIFFNEWSQEIATTAILIAFVMFFASFAVKQAGLDFLLWLTKQEKKSEQPAGIVEEIGVPAVAATSRSRVIRVLRESRPSRNLPHHTRAVLFANAWSFSAISVILALRFLLNSSMI